MKWAITEKFHEYLYHQWFTICPLTYILTTAWLDTASLWCIASLANYNFSILYRSRKTNADADSLSQSNWLLTASSTELAVLGLSQPVFTARLDATLCRCPSPIHSYRSNLYILDPSEQGLDIAKMMRAMLRQTQLSSSSFGK